MLQGVPTESAVMRELVARVRSYLRDTPDLNRLVAGEESGDRQIAFAIMDAVEDFNGTPPFTRFPLEYLVMKSQVALLTRMTVITLLESITALQMRNQINYSAGAINVAVNDKAPLLMSFVQYLKASTEQQKLRVKVAMNIESIMSPSDHGVHSEYWFQNGIL